MIVTLSVNVEDIDALLAILDAGRYTTGNDYEVIPGTVVAYQPAPPYVYDVKTVKDLGTNAAHHERLVTDDYWRAPSGEGPQAATWKDKPHRLVYDLVGEVEYLRARLLPESP